MVSNGDRKTNNFGKLVRQKVGPAKSWFAGGAPVVVVRLPPSMMRAESKGVRAGSEAMHSETQGRANKQRRRFRCQGVNRARQRSE